MPNPPLSKSTFLRGLQCEKSLWLYKNRYAEKDPIDPLQEAIFAQGTEVGLVAQGLFPGGKDGSVSHFEQEAGALKTRALIESGEDVIYEAVFIQDGVYIAVDILVKSDQGWQAYEVKSSTSLKDTYIDDTAIQYWVLKEAGLRISSISVVYINNQYLRKGEIELRKLFIIEPVTEKILRRLGKVPRNISHFKALIRFPNPPGTDIGEHCFTPYTCDYKGSCWKHVPKYSVFDISRLGKRKMFQLYEQGILTLDQINLEEHEFNPKQTLQIRCEQEGKSHLEPEKLDAFLRELNYPLYFLDFETFGPAVPVYENSRPYQQLVFQYSLHVRERPGGSLKHLEYLSEPNSSKDPRKDLADSLIQNLGKEGDILVYNIRFERSKLQELIDQFPELAGSIAPILFRLKDLMVPFQEKWFYTPEMMGSYSIKNVLPAMVPELDYSELDIKEGGTASLIYYQMVKGTYSGDTTLAKQALLDYCELDTLAMVRILEALEKAMNVD